MQERKGDKKRRETYWSLFGPQLCVCLWLTKPIRNWLGGQSSALARIDWQCRTAESTSSSFSLPLCHHKSNLTSQASWLRGHTKSKKVWIILCVITTLVSKRGMQLRAGNTWDCVFPFLHCMTDIVSAFQKMESVFKNISCFLCFIGYKNYILK